MCLGVPGEIVSTHARDDLAYAQVRFGGIEREVCLEYARDAQPGDWVLVHVGFAIAVIDRDEAERTLDALRRLQSLGEDGDEIPG